MGTTPPRARHRNRPLQERNREDVVDVEATADCIDLTDDVIDLTSPTQLYPPQPLNDRPVYIVPITDRQAVTPPRRRRERRHHVIDIVRRIDHLDLDEELPTPDRGNSPELISPNSPEIIINVPAIGSSENNNRNIEMSPQTYNIGAVNSPGIRRISCPVCMDDYKELQQRQVQLMSTICGHVFCKECIEAAVRANHQCPTCRKRLSERQIHPIFL